MSPKKIRKPLTPQEFASRQLEKGAERASRGLTDFTRTTHRAYLEDVKAGVDSGQTRQGRRLREFMQEGTIEGRKPKRKK